MRDYRHGGGVLAQNTSDVVAFAEGGMQGKDPMAAQAMERYMERFGRALATVIDILDPDAIVLGGGLSHTERLYRDGPSYIARYVFSDDFRTPILRNKHGDASGVRGAAMLW